MIIIWICLSLANAFIAGMNYSLILTYQQDGNSVALKQWAMVVICGLLSVALQVAIVGRASQL